MKDWDSNMIFNPHVTKVTLKLQCGRYNVYQKLTGNMC